MESLRAWIRCVCVYNALLQEGECLGGLESRTWRILSHDGTIEQGLVNILRQFPVVLASLTANHHTWVIGGAAHHTQNLASGWFDGNNTSLLARHQAFAQSLKLHIKRKSKILTRNWGLIKFTILITSFDTTTRVAKEYLHALFTTQLLLVLTFNTQFAYIVTTIVIIVFLNILRPYLAHITQHMGCIGIGILADTTLLNIESGIRE